MSILNRTTLKSLFVSGTAANQSKFEDVFDSHYNINEDSLLQGPLGLTGSYGVLGPAGGTHHGLWISTGAAPGSSAAAGSTGQVVVAITGSTGAMYIHNGSQWFKFSGLSDF